MTKQSMVITYDRRVIASKNIASAAQGQDPACEIEATPEGAPVVVCDDEYPDGPAELMRCLVARNQDRAGWLVEQFSACVLPSSLNIFRASLDLDAAAMRDLGVRLNAEQADVQRMGCDISTFQTALEVYGAWEQVDMWDWELFEAYARDILDSIEPGSIYFGGSDAGRFAVTAFASVRKEDDVVVLTQNALADNLYAAYLRTLYGDRIWIPSQEDSNFAFQKYVQDVQSGRFPPDADLVTKGGRVTVQGIQGVMAINGILVRMIFEANKKDHAFYVEESYVIPWMYPYLEPHGLIMKINAEPVNISSEMVNRDGKFWDAYARRLTSNPKFHRDVAARKSFSKLRSAIAGIYASRRMFPEAEKAFRQAIDLYPQSPEANFRLADIFMQQFRFADARKLTEELRDRDPENDKVEKFLSQIRDLESSDIRRRDLEQVLQKGGDINSALELCDIYRKLNLQQMFDGLSMNIINQTNVPPNVMLQLAQMYADSNRIDMLASTLERYLQRQPDDQKVWVDLAAALASLHKSSETIEALQKAIETGGESTRELVRNDDRFESMRDMAEFRALWSKTR